MGNERVALKSGKEKCFYPECGQEASCRIRIGMGVFDSCAGHEDAARAEAQRINFSLGVSDANVLHNCVNRLAFKD